MSEFASAPRQHTDRKVRADSARRSRTAGSRSSDPGAATSKYACPCGGACPKCGMGRSGGLPPGVIGTLGSRGEALDPMTKARMESCFGQDFARVRVHADERAAASANALGALAYTAGNDIVFGRGQYAPRKADGARLLAHELTHVVQQRNAARDAPGFVNTDGALEREADAAADRATSPPGSIHVPRVSGAAPLSIQRQPITGSQSSVPVYETQLVGGSPQQVKGTSTMSGVAMPLSYDPATGAFTVTFPLAWIFAHAWPDARRNTYVQDFVTSVMGVWNNRFVLNETGVAHPRSANVTIAFDNYLVPQLASAADEQADLNIQQMTRRRWTMDVRDLAVQENVDRATSVVQLGLSSNQPQRRTAAQLRAQSSFSYSGSGGNRTFSQAASPHEFGHMIGLGDEYVSDVAGASVPSAARGFINDRIMNVGQNVTADAYAPFADWLSGLTSTTWRVGRRV